MHLREILDFHRPRTSVTTTIDRLSLKRFVKLLLMEIAFRHVHLTPLDRNFMQRSFVQREHSGRSSS